MKRIPLALLGLSLMTLPLGAFAGSDYAPSRAGVPLEVTMSENGRAVVKGARVREVSDNGFTAETMWGSSKLTWNVQTTERTPVTRKDGKGIELTQVTPGDYVSFTGTIQANMSPFTVNADSVRDWSVTPNRVVHSGTVESIDAEARTLTVITAKGGTLTVRTNDDTAYAQSGARVFGDISEGDSVIAFGEGSGATLAASKVNLTERASVARTPTSRIATGLGAWVDNFLPMFFVGRMI